VRIWYLILSSVGASLVRKRPTSLKLFTLICSYVRNWGLNFHFFWFRWRCIFNYLRFPGNSWQHPNRIGSYIYLRLLFLVGRGPNSFLSMNASIFSFITWLEKKYQLQRLPDLDTYYLYLLYNIITGGFFGEFYFLDFYSWTTFN